MTIFRGILLILKLLSIGLCFIATFYYMFSHLTANPWFAAAPFLSALFWSIVLELTKNRE